VPRNSPCFDKSESMDLRSHLCRAWRDSIRRGPALAKRSASSDQPSSRPQAVSMAIGSVGRDHAGKEAQRPNRVGAVPLGRARRWGHLQIFGDDPLLDAEAPPIVWQSSSSQSWSDLKKTAMAAGAAMFRCSAKRPEPPAILRLRSMPPHGQYPHAPRVEVFDNPQAKVGFQYWMQSSPRSIRREWDQKERRGRSSFRWRAAAPAGEKLQGKLCGSDSFDEPSHPRAETALRLCFRQTSGLLPERTRGVARDDELVTWRLPSGACGGSAGAGNYGRHLAR